MITWDDVEAWGVRLAGAAGALVSMRFLSGTVFERSIMAVGGAFFAFYATEWVAGKVGLPEGLTGFLLGLFGMSILSRTYEWIQSTNMVRAVLDRLAEIWLGRNRPNPDKGEEK